MKSSKPEGGRNSQLNGAATPRETGPLFPRLHVSDTEKAGPRPPPRNKMALFEQFTVPSHRFVQPQPSSPSTVLSNQPQQFDYRHPYFAYRTPSSVQYTTARPQPSHGSSSCVTSSVSESRRASGSQISEKYRLSRATTKEDGSINLSSLLEEKAKVVSDDVLMQQSPPRAHVKTQGTLYTTSAFKNICAKFVSASAESAEMPVTTVSKNDLLEAMRIEREVVACPVVEGQGCCEDKAELNKRKEVADALLTKRETLEARSDESSHGCSSFASEQSCQQPDVDRDKVLPEDSSHDLTEVASNPDLKNNGGREGQSSSPSGNCLTASAQTSRSLELLGSLHIRKDSFPSDSEKRDARASADVPPKDKGENTGDSQYNQMGSNEVSELSQQGTGRDTGDSPLSVLVGQAIRPKDVIRAVGQQHFWKARKALLRQQRIFSDQVFQLHKLIKVQQLLAETPGTLIDEEMLFGAVDDCAGSPSQCNIEGRENDCDEKAQVTSSLKEQGSKVQGIKTGIHPEIKQNPQRYGAVGNDGMGSTIPYMPAFTPGGVSAWGYPSMGMGQWMGMLPAQGRPSTYQPFPGAFSPGAPFGGLYGPGQVSPMMPFCMPYASQRSEAWEEMSSNHGPPVAAGSSSQAAPALGQVAHDVPGAWQFVQYNIPSHHQGFHAGVPEKNASIGSGASINHQRPAGTGLILGEASHAGRLNKNKLENSINQSETSSPSSSAYMRPTQAPRKSGSYQQKAEQPAQMSINSVFREFSSSKQHGAGGRKEAHKVAAGNALDLFPLVPSLSTVGGQSSSKQANALWQGRVIKAVPHSAVNASQSTAGILLSLQRERRQ
ncbi:hypothetical protein GOP47_0029474 [Adiantum capillus-veneris]|nr:hypothetical protein GOP47_0029474 [Adiantum capillus-veneris]